MPHALKVLIAEDNPVDAELLVRELRRAGFEPDWRRVDNEGDFLAGLHDGLDLVLSDYEMPQFNGLQALELLKKSGLDIPFIIVSGTIGEDTAVAVMKQGATDYLLKDRLARLGAAVTHALAETRLRRERRQAAEALRIANAQLGQLLEHSPAVLYMVKLDGDTILPNFVSENVTHLLGFTVAETLSDEWWLAALHPEDHDRAVKSVTETVEAGANQTEYRLRHKNGEYRWVDDTRRLIRNASGRPAEFIGVWTDITERKRAEETLQQATGHVARNRRKQVRIDLVILVAASVLIWMFSARFNWFESITTWILKYDVEQVDEITITAIFFTAGLAVFAFRRWRETKSELTGRHQAQAALGLLHEELDQRVKRRTQELGNANQALRGEIAERRRTEQSLRDSELRFGTAFRSSPAAIVINRRRDLVNLEVNDAFLRLFDCTREQIVGHTLVESGFVEAPTVMAFRAQLDATGTADDQEMTGRTSRGKLIHINVSIRTIQLGGEECALSTMVDITERKKAGQKIRDQLDELLRWQEVMLNREDRVQALKQEVNELLAQQKLPARYPSQLPP